MSDSDDQLTRVESVIGWCRTATVVSIVVLILSGIFPRIPYPRPAWITVIVAFLYTLIAPPLLSRFLSPIRRAAFMTAIDTILVLIFLAATGGARSPAAPYLSFPIILVAMRFGLVFAIALAMAEGAVLAFIAVFIPAPADAHLVWFSLWWQFVLLIVAILVGTLRRFVYLEQSGRLNAQHVASQERLQRLAIENEARQREQLMRIVVHEFRTPIASLSALSRHLAGAQCLVADLSNREALRLVQCHVEHLTEMIDTLRQAATSGRRDAMDRIEFRNVFLPGLLEAAVAAAGGNPQNVAVEIDSACNNVRVDAARTRRVVTNLVENALRYNDFPSPVLVEARLVPEGLSLVVSDRGPGLGGADRKSAFQEDASLSQHDGTSGLGLWIVDQLVTGLGGSVEPRPREGGGLSVHVLLPMSVPADETDVAPLPHDHRARS